MNTRLRTRNPAFRAARIRGIFIALAMACIGFPAGAYEIIPSVPERHFNDGAGMISPKVAARLDAQLVQFEKDTGNQIVVAIYPNMLSDASVEDYGKRVVLAWHAERKDEMNGLELLLFVRDHVATLQIGPGCNKIVTEAMCEKILSNDMGAYFQKGDFSGGLVAAINAMMAAMLGKYGDRAGAPAPPSTPTPTATPTPVPRSQYKATDDSFTLSPAATATPSPKPQQNGN